ncbi:hypothetical protein JXO59_02430 [candidate division KSB1 bacterium]|nr:hypothetical protein [candidate division KSB1 bacterium]
MSHHIIRKIRLAHCKRGPSRCEKCREMDQGKICLLDIGPFKNDLAQRRVIEVCLDGTTTWREFEVVRVFEDRNQAAQYAVENHIDDVSY